ncbi:hypothetical protein ACLK1Y_24640 [Escherichia coli]
MQLALNVGAMLLACYRALIALLNGMLSGIGGWFNHPELSAAADPSAGCLRRWRG